MNMNKENLYSSVLFIALLVLALIMAYGIEDYRIAGPPEEPEVEEEVVVEPDEPVEDAEIYTGSAEGFGGELVVEVSLEEDEIVGIEVIEHQETDDYFADAVPEVPERIIKAQSTDVDAVSGATETSEAVKAAVDAALAEAEIDEEVEAEVYTGSAEGYGGELVVEVSAENDTITAVEIVEHQETESFFEDAVPEMPDRILEAQSTEVDAVSGATETSEAIMAAVDEALAGIDTEPEEEPELDEGEIYEGTAEGYGGELTVEVTVDEDEILDVVVVEHVETEDLAEPALEEVPESIVASQSIDVDAVSGVTVTSEAIMAAAEEALIEAGVIDEDPEVEEEVDAEIYTGSAEGFGGELVVEVSLEEDEIVGIEVIEHQETDDYFADAVPEVPERIMEAQSTDVDAVSGATETSEAVKAAVDAALAEAEIDEVAGEIYQGTAEGYGGELQLEVEVKEGEILDVRIIEHEEHEETADYTLEELPERIVAAQSHDVDGISGVTVTSEAIMAAAEEALNEAGLIDEDPEVEEEVDAETYTGSAEGYGGELVLEVSLENDEIIGIEIIDHLETENFFEDAVPEMPERIIEAQSTEVDTVSGATETSEAIISAVEEALEAVAE
ncbi:FMN-binding protein [Halarsenatibacter silvermanii]|uniref:Uncharacterized protein, contains FMN-binding domain n=1 Tax=Halarsenatibacter silvermanii TaxID=321763 RepID=A0A1G9KKK8_9FIRM|nr:FMN-binding protein [Halarsenatibacter silvermanii]SDL49943.1 Uncharacterized protein, contains FMN-binding domain [Halarsenatibacter silvermanii]